MVDAAATTRLLLARHGEVDEAHRGTIYGRLDVPLSAVGLGQSAALAAALADTPLDAVVSSGLSRAEAAAALARRGRGLPRQDDPRLVELDRGRWAGQGLAALASEDPEGFARWGATRGALRAPGGEAPEELQARVVPALTDWAARHPGGTVLVVAHLWVVRAAVAWALGLPMAVSPRIGLQPGGLVALDWPVGGSERPSLVALGMAPPGSQRRNAPRAGAEPGG